MTYTVTKALYLGGARYMPGQSIELDPKEARRLKHLLKKNSNSLPEKQAPVEAPKEVVAAEKTRRDEIEAQIEKLRASLSELD